MSAIFRRIGLRPRKIRTLIASWAGSILLVWAVLVGGWFAAENRLTMIGDRVVADVGALSEARDLESQILAFRRNDLLWQATHQADYQEHANGYLQEARKDAAELDPYATTGYEQHLVAQIRLQLEALGREWVSEPRAALPAAAHAADDLLQTVDHFQAENDKQMEASMVTADHLRQIVTYWTLGLSVGTAFLLLIGALSLTQRIIRPATNVAGMAEAFGRGDFSARATVLHDDELGAVARTFNNMADDIANREKDRLQFVAVVVHDLKNPVLAIDMATRMLDSSRTNDEQRRSYLKGIREEVARLRTIIRDLTDDIQVVNGRFSVHKTRVDLGALTRHFVETQSGAFATHRIVLEKDDNCIIQGDAGRIERVLTNLVSNAVKYSPPGTRVCLGVEKKRSRAVLTVCDEGPGIADEDLKVLFQPFGRGRSAGTLAEGSGIGLYVVKQIVEAHDGRIEVRSEPGHGATFRIEFPLARKTEAVL